MNDGLGCLALGFLRELERGSNLVSDPVRLGLDAVWRGLMGARSVYPVV